MRSPVRPFPALLSFLIVLAGSVLSCSAPSSSPEKPGHARESGEEHSDEHTDEGIVELNEAIRSRLDIRTAKVEKHLLPAELLTTGQVDFDQNRLTHVTPRIPGRVDVVKVDLGDEIRKGQILIWIDSIELGQAKAAYLQARAQEDLARQNFTRESDLYTEHIAAEQDMLAARAAHLEAVARLRSAEETLRLYGLSTEQVESLTYEDPAASLLPVRAPLSGRVVEKHVTRGELVTPERNMFTLANLERVWIWIDIYERDLRGVHLDDDVDVEVASFPGELFSGKVTYLSDQVDVDSRTVRARIDVPNPKKQLRPGMFARVRLTDPHQANGELATAPVLVVPEAAIQRDGDGFIVFVKLDAHRFQRRSITTGRLASGLREIKEGLAPGDEVAVTKTFLLKSEASKEQMSAGDHD